MTEIGWALFLLQLTDVLLQAGSQTLAQPPAAAETPNRPAAHGSPGIISIQQQKFVDSGCKEYVFSGASALLPLFGKTTNTVACTACFLSAVVSPSQECWNDV